MLALSRRWHVDVKRMIAELEKSEDWHLIPKTPVLLLVYVGFIVATVFLPPCMDSSSYAASIIDKQKRLETITSPKLVLVGGSNLALGLDSSLLKRQLEIEPVNMGLTINCGLAFELEQVRDHLRQGDVVVISPEYEYFMQNARGNGWIFELPKLLPEASLWTFKTTTESPVVIAGSFNTFSGWLRSKWDFWRGMANKYVASGGQAGLLPPKNWGEKDFLGRKNFDSYGDLLGYLKVKPPEQICVENWQVDKINADAVKLLNNFARDAKARGATVLLVPPPLPDTVFERHAVEIATIYNGLKEQVRIPFIAAPERYEFPVGQFFDSYYHLRGSARQERSQRLSQDIRAHLSLADSASIE
ncbi:MAG TPA: hypothetical protein V6C72_00175 [Chroococcales cyanobacterium]